MRIKYMLREKVVRQRRGVLTHAGCFISDTNTHNMRTMVRKYVTCESIVFVHALLHFVRNNNETKCGSSRPGQATAALREMECGGPTMSSRRQEIERVACEKQVVLQCARAQCSVPDPDALRAYMHTEIALGTHDADAPHMERRYTPGLGLVGRSG